MAASQSGSAKISLGVVIPVLDDWESLRRLLPEIEQEVGDDSHLYFCVVDDGSLIQTDVAVLPVGAHSIALVQLTTNLGHQRAICVGLNHISQLFSLDAVVVMDADGEDSPRALKRLIARLQGDSPQVAVARRATRTEKWKFRLLYRVYKLLFRVLTGNRLDFGNFSVLNRPAVDRLVASPELWNHYPAAIMRSGIPIHRESVARAHRYAGHSRMNTSALVGHGLAGLSVFLDRVLARLLVITLFFAALLGALILSAVILRLAWQVPMPGWFALGTTAASVVLVQLAGMLVLLTFIALAQRSRHEPAPRTFVNQYIARVSVQTPQDSNVT